MYIDIARTFDKMIVLDLYPFIKLLVFCLFNANFVFHYV